MKLSPTLSFFSTSTSLEGLSFFFGLVVEDSNPPKVLHWTYFIIPYATLVPLTKKQHNIQTNNMYVCILIFIYQMLCCIQFFSESFFNKCNSTVTAKKNFVLLNSGCLAFICHFLLFILIYFSFGRRSACLPEVILFLKKSTTFPTLMSICFSKNKMLCSLEIFLQLCDTSKIFEPRESGKCDWDHIHNLQ